MTKSIVKAQASTELETDKEIIESHVVLGKSVRQSRGIKIVGAAVTSVAFAVTTLVTGITPDFIELLTVPASGILGAYGFMVTQRAATTYHLPAQMHRHAFESGLNHEQAKIVLRETISALKLYRWVPGGTVTITNKSSDMSHKNAVQFQLVLGEHEAELNVVKDPLADFDNAFISALEISGKSFDELSESALSEKFRKEWMELRKKRSSQIAHENLQRQELTAIIKKDCSIGYEAYEDDPDRWW